METSSWFEESLLVHLPLYEKVKKSNESNYKKKFKVGRNIYIHHKHHQKPKIIKTYELLKTSRQSQVCKFKACTTNTIQQNVILTFIKDRGPDFQLTLIQHYSLLN